jgi:hexosaminidase
MTAEECRCCEIYDRPRFPWRGSLLDTGRHFFDKEFVKKYIDILAFHKFNRFHFHLTEDQGWRIEIKKYPQLTEQGAYRRENGSVYGGYFTRQDIKEIVAYAKERHIMVIPEIDMPGHCYSALSVFPELSCSGGPFVQEARWGVYKDVYCAGNEKVYSFLQDVLDEIIDLFDSPYIHIGGDECPKDQWSQCPRCQDMIKRNGLAGVNKLQSYFIRRIQKYLASKNKTIIGWDEIMTGGLPDNAVVQIWHGDGIDKSVECAKSGNKMIMSPQFHCYLNHPYEILPLNMFYDYEPIANVLEPGVKEKLEENVLGIEACVWTEYIPNESEFNFKVFPRLFGLAEVAWSQGSNKDYKDYQLRLKKHIDVFRKLFDIDCDMHKRFEYHLKRLRELYDV